MVYNRVVGSNTIHAYGEILGFFGQVAYEYGQEFVIIPDFTENPVGCRNFWQLYKKKAKNVEAMKEWNRMFATGKPWKHPRDGSWRFYFNLTDEAKQTEKQYQVNLSVQIREIAERDAIELFDKSVDETSNQKQIAYSEMSDIEVQEMAKNDRKKIRKVSPGFNFSADQLKTIKNLK